MIEVDLKPGKCDPATQPDEENETLFDVLKTAGERGINALDRTTVAALAEALRKLSLLPANSTPEAKAAVPEGIGRMTDAEFLQKIEVLRTFSQVGAICRARGTSTFNFAEMAIEIALGEATVRRRMIAASEFLRSCFMRYESLAVPADDDYMATRETKLIDRGQGKKRTMICALGWRAWEIIIRRLEQWDSH